MTTEQTESTAEPLTHTMAEQISAAAASLAADEGYESDAPVVEDEAPTEAAPEPAPEAEPEAVDAAPAVVEESSEPEPTDDTQSLAALYEQNADLTRQLTALQDAPKPEPHAAIAALESRDPAAVLAALASSGVDFDSLARHVLEDPAATPEAAAQPDPRDARIEALEAQFKAQADKEAEAATQAAQATQQSAVTAHITAKAEQFPIVSDMGRADLVLAEMRETHGGTIPAFRSDAEAALAVEQAAKRVESALANELTGYLKIPAIKAHLAAQLGQTASPTETPTRTGTRDGEGNAAPVINNATAGQRASLGVDDDPDDDELERRAVAAMQAQMARVG